MDISNRQQGHTDYLIGLFDPSVLAANYRCGHCNSDTRLTYDDHGMPHLVIEHDDGCPVLTGALTAAPDVLRASREGVVTELDPDLAAQIRASVDARLAAQVQAARVRIGDKRAVRDAFGERRKAGVQHRNAARAARLGLIAHHNSKETTVSTIPADLATWTREDVEHWLYRIAHTATDAQYDAARAAAGPVIFGEHHTIFACTDSRPPVDHLARAGFAEDFGYNDRELQAIRAYLRRTDAYEDTLAFDAETLPHMESLGGRDEALGYARSMLSLLGEWHLALDSLHAEINNPDGHMGDKARAYVAGQTNQFLWHLHTVRREVCRYLLGTVGPEPAIEDGAAVYSDFPYIQLDATAVTH